MLTKPTIAALLAIASIASIACYGCGSSHGTIATDPIDGSTSAGGSSGSGQIDSGKSPSGGSGGGSQLDSGAEDSSPEQDAQVEDIITTDINWEYDTFRPDSGLDDACVNQVVEAERVPLDIYFMMDRSGSMRYPAHGDHKPYDCNVDTVGFVPSANSKWCKAINALAGYVSNAEAKGNKAAIQYFTHPLHQSSESCKDAKYYSTGETELIELTGTGAGHAAAIVASLNKATPSGYTPTEAALLGLAEFTKAKRKPGRVIIGILITDGAPEWKEKGKCSNDDKVLKGIPEQLFQTEGIHTFMVGIDGANFKRLENWANYRGAISHRNDRDNCGDGQPTCHHYNVGNADYDVFVRALRAIQSSAHGCSFKFPEPEGVLDLARVSVEYFKNGNPPPVSLTRVANQAACGAIEGYYFDDNANPKIVHLCPTVCDQVMRDSNPKVQIQIACQGS